MKIAAAYIRVSTEDQVEYSPESQRKAIIDYAKGNNYMLLPLTPDTSPVHHGIAN